MTRMASPNHCHLSEIDWVKFMTPTVSSLLLLSQRLIPRPHRFLPILFSSPSIINHNCTNHRNYNQNHQSLRTSQRRRMSSSSAKQPAWALPVPIQSEPVLKIYNSLTRTKTEFIPKSGRSVKWYNCGPTVYDASHMGHARNYVTQDVLRRIMEDYFGYDVHFVMNITDIDDKIIKRARQNHLLEKFRADTTLLDTNLISQVDTAWRAFLRNELAAGLPVDERTFPTGTDEEIGITFARIAELVQSNKEWKQECLKRDEKFDMNFISANRTLAAIRNAGSSLKTGTTSQEEAHKLIDDSQDILVLFLDEQYKSTVTSPSLSRTLAFYWENQFFQDMHRLNVRDPDTLTRVTEYMPEIITFVEKIIGNGYAYESGGSVYFDTKAFDDAPSHDYAKLEPWSKGKREGGETSSSNSTAVSTGADANTVVAASGEAPKFTRHSSSDFALWKATKPGEPSWDSPWGPGRPGWHIECSVMASAVLGENMDIHSGGIDLAFPHHDNEMAQSEAYHDCPTWVNYFVHTGHLHIEGLKMSKSLKNFITIDEILQRYSSRQIRLAFLTQLWNAKVDFSESLMAGEVRNLESTLNNFFTNIKALVNQARDSGVTADGYHHYGSAEKELVAKFQQSQHSFRSALCDSFNTPEALDVLRDLVSRTNTYISSCGKAVNVRVVENLARWVGKMLRMFGLGEGESKEIGWGQEGSSEGAIDREEILMPYLRTLSIFRDGVRKLAIDKGDSALKNILTLCDKLRDEELIPLGVALDDQEDGKALVKLAPPSVLLAARDEKRAILLAKQAKKEAAKEAERVKRLERLAKGKLNPKDMFLPPHVAEGTYGTYDESVVPLTDGDGKELSKSARKKLMKERESQVKLHEEWLRYMEVEKEKR
ncbi:tRNA synthetases class I (C) catalytic domain-containing protein [Lentinula aciculospora]|uniref:cysteine--tRNA ligase n=1 Tax=Lentinula aciculospora TaxID=153920 RepID=A0A9W9A470_9AGAR|nr:tRNA synthetases class I (C) catalytic domain-containing protein [Lentinula aciculospora]